MTSEHTPGASISKLLQALTRSIDALTPLDEPLPVGHFWGFVITILHTLRTLSMVWDNRPVMLPDGDGTMEGTGYTDEEVRLIINTMVTAGKQPLPLDKCAECVMLQAQLRHTCSRSIRDLENIKCDEHRGMRATRCNISMDYLHVYTPKYRHGCYTAAMLCYASLLPPIVHLERLTRPVPHHLLGHSLEDCNRDTCEESRVTIPWMTGKLACEIRRTTKHTHWLSFIWINESGIEETLAVMQTTVYTDDETRYTVQFEARNIQLASINCKFNSSPFASSQTVRMTERSKSSHCGFSAELCESLLPFIGEQLEKGYRFASRSGCLDLVSPDGEPFHDIVVSCITYVGSSKGLTGNGYSEGHTYAAGQWGYLTMCVTSVYSYPFGGLTGTPDGVCHSVLADGRTKDSILLIRMAWVSVVVRVASTRRTFTITSV